jgi:hypothetical protein
MEILVHQHGLVALATPHGDIEPIEVVLEQGSGFC